MIQSFNHEPPVNEPLERERPVKPGREHLLPETSRPSIGDLVRDAKNDAQLWLESEKTLISAELESKVNTATTQIGKLTIGAIVAANGLGLLLITLGFVASWGFRELGLDLVPAYCAGFGVLGLVVAIIGYGLLKSAKNKLSASELSLTRSAESIQETKEWAKDKVS